MTRESYDRMFKISVTILMASLILLIIQFFFKMTGCGISPEKETVYVHPSKCGDFDTGEIKKESCEGGEKVSVCSSGDWLEISNSCGQAGVGCEQITFQDDIKPLVDDKCLGCHFSPERYDDPAVFRKYFDESLRLVNLSNNDPSRMPKFPAPELSFGEKRLLEGWRADGFLDNCDGVPSDGPDFGFLDLDYIEDNILLDQNRLDESDRENTRYLVSTHRRIEGQDDREFEIFEKAANKTLNSLSFERDIFAVTPVDLARSIYRLDLRAIGWDAADWQSIEYADPFKIVSNTAKGRLIRILADANQPWFHLENFINITQQPDVYYSLLDLPGTFGELADQLGVDYVEDLSETFDGRLIGFNGSPISNQKNRLLSRHESDDGFMWITYDPVDLDGVPERNLLEFPLLAETGGKRVFDFAAGEVIFTLPNGFLGYMLVNNRGIRQNDAPINIVVDTESPVKPAPAIVNAISCHRCHSAGIIPSVDQIRNAVIANASEFDAIDVELVKALYKGPATNAALFANDNKHYKQALEKAGISQGDPDPLTASTDQFLLDWSLKEVAGFFFRGEDEFKQLLNQSAQGKAQVGQLLTGGSITFDQLVQVAPILIEDLRLFEDRLGQ